MNITTVEHRRALVAAAHSYLAKMRAPHMTIIGVYVLADLAAEALEAAIAIDERAARSGPRPGGRTT